MIVGLGVDLCSISRMERCCADDSFVRRVFVEEEISLARSRARPAAHWAAWFAAREAFAKASGLGMARMGFKGVWVCHDENGRPVLRLSNGLALAAFRDVRIFLSLSHEGDMAVASVVIER